MNNLLCVFLARLTIAAFWGVIGYVIVLYFLNALVMPFRKQKDLRKAVDEGRVVVAMRKKVIFPKDCDLKSLQNHYIGIYEYEVNGCKYNYHGKYNSTPPIKEKLYYKKNPSKAKNEVFFGNVESGKWVIFSVITGIAFVVGLM